jgi:hypothetical protein
MATSDTGLAMDGQKMLTRQIHGQAQSKIIKKNFFECNAVSESSAIDAWTV